MGEEKEYLLGILYETFLSTIITIICFYLFVNKTKTQQKLIDFKSLDLFIPFGSPRKKNILNQNKVEKKELANLR